MQFLWLAFDGIAGRDIGMNYILKFLLYTSLQIVPMALPIAVLLSSIMAMGNLSEHYEISALKAAGVSLKRVLRPLIFMVVLLGGFSFLFLNYVYPFASFKQRNLYYGMQKQKPAFSLIEGSFNNDIPGYSIKFEKKYGPEKNKLKDVHILDLRDTYKNNKIIKAKRGEIYTEEGSKYMTLKLYDGFFFRDHTDDKYTQKHRQKMPASYAHFERYDVNFDISDFVSRQVDEDEYKSHYMMLTLSQLAHFSDSLSTRYHSYLQERSKNFENFTGAYQFYKISKDNLKNDSIFHHSMIGSIKNTKERMSVVKSAIASVKETLEDINSYHNNFKIKRKILNLYDFEFYRRMSFSLAPWVLFLIGAPLGALIRKGGFGYPMVLAIIIFMLYYVMDSMAKNIAEESSLTTLFAAWLSTLVLLPFGILLARSATRGIGLVSFDRLKNTWTVIKIIKKKSSR